MSAVFLPQGFYSPRRRGSFVQPYALRGGIASAYNTSIGIGDPIKFVTGGVIQLAAAGDAIIAGVFAGWLPEDPSVYEKTYWAANTTYVKAPVVYWYPADEETVFSVAAVGSVAQTAIGDAADHVAGTLNTRSGKSGAYLDTANLAGAAASAQWKIVGLRQEPGNDWGDTYTLVDVIANEPGLGFRAGNAI